MTPTLRLHTGRLRPQPSGSDDRGSATVFLAITMVGLIFMIGLIADGGSKIHAIRRADVLAAEAARAGGQAINLPAVIAGGRPAVDPQAARAAALAYLTANGATGTATITDGGQRVTVDITASSPTVFLGLVGIDHITVHGHATANLVRGIREVIP